MCKRDKRRGVGRAMRDPFAAKRRIGLSRRYTRRTLGREFRHYK